MFHDLSVLFKHKLFMQNPNSNKRKKRGPLFLILFLIGMFFLITNNMIGIYNQLSVLEFNDANFGDVYMNFIITFFSLFFVLSFTSMMSFQLKRNEEIEFLLTLPIQKTSIVTYQLLISSVSMLLFLVLFIAPVVAFFTSKSAMFIVLGSAGVLFNVVLLLFIGAVFAVLLSKVASQKMIRIWLIVVNMLYGLSYVLLFQILPNNISKAEELPAVLLNANNFFGSYFNVFSMGMNAGEKPVYLLILLGLIIIFGALYFYLSNKLNFSKTKMKRGKAHISDKDSKGNVLLKKELVIYRRNEQLIYYIFYPVGFGLLMGFINKDFLSALSIISFMGIMFVSMQTAFSMSVEGSSIGLTKMLPIDLSKFIRVKLAVPVAINCSLLVIVFLIFTLFMEVNPITLLLIPIITVVQIMASMSGINFTLKKEPQKMSNPTAFMRSSSFMFQFLVLISLAVLTIVPVTLFLLKAVENASLLINSLMLTASLVGLIITILLSVRLWNTIKKKILVW